MPRDFKAAALTEDVDAVPDDALLRRIVAAVGDIDEAFDGLEATGRREVETALAGKVRRVVRIGRLVAVQKRRPYARPKQSMKPWLGAILSNCKTSVGSRKPFMIHCCVVPPNPLGDGSRSRMPRKSATLS